MWWMCCENYCHGNGTQQIRAILSFILLLWTQCDTHNLGWIRGQVIVMRRKVNKTKLMKYRAILYWMIAIKGTKTMQSWWLGSNYSCTNNLKPYTEAHFLYIGLIVKYINWLPYCIEIEFKITYLIFILYSKDYLE